MIAGFAMPGCKLRLWDGDTVEPANITRQAFLPCELGANKAEALALRLTGQFGLSVTAVAEHLTEKRLRADTKARDTYGRHTAGEPLAGSLVITCTDNMASRRLVARVHEGWWLDVGNTMTVGQAVLGCTHRPETLGRTVREWGNGVVRMPEPEPAPLSSRDIRVTGTLSGMWRGMKIRRAPAPPIAPELVPLVGLHRVEILPDLAAVDPTLMTSRRSGPAGPSCAAMPFAVQGFAVNEMAALAAASLAKALLVDGRLTSGAVFFDAAAGRMTPRPITRDWFEIGKAAGKKESEA